MRAIKSYFSDGLVGTVNRGVERRSPRGHAKNAPSGRVKCTVPPGSSGMEYFDAFHLVRVLDPFDFFADLNRARISPGCHDHAHRRILRPAEISVTHAALNGSFDCFEQIAIQAHHDRLSFRIAEAAVEFEHHG